MQVTPSQHPKATLLVAIGRIDQGSAADFLAGLQAGIAQRADPAMPVVIDFSGVDYISSVGLRALMLVARQIKSVGGRIGIAALQPLVGEVFGIARFDLVIPCFTSIEDAVAGLAA